MMGTHPIKLLIHRPMMVAIGDAGTSMQHNCQHASSEYGTTSVPCINSAAVRTVPVVQALDWIVC